ncbi:aspartic proteinase nepenthesin-1 [Cucumis sativus]|uniref:Peptidase A1 domain-containing protein n=1 Tax=Cucumis sativus TaxID=3659 RepID=A0A0A0KYT9_CUCSA|nr:aspartic proteinase nepenthesin-1 [Cucumis sativus]KGN54860.1 hypothetical protein Csa_012038 [Cucumis sativus]
MAAVSLRSFGYLHRLLLIILITTLFINTLAFSSSLSRRALQKPNKLPSHGFRVRLKHVDHVKNLTRFERLRRGVARGKNRLHRLNAMVLAAANATVGDQVKAPVVAGNGEFLMKLAIGSPPRSFSAIMDTGSDLIWTQCKPCQQCFDQSTPIFDPKQSSSFYKISCSSELCGALPTSTCSSDGCEYLYTYGDSSSTQGVLAFETFTFGDSTEDQISIPGLGFGCGNDNNGDGFSQGAGLVGLGRGPLSLVSQLKEQKFAYCLTAIDDSKPSSLLLGSLANITPKTSKDEMKTTPLIKNPSQPSFYYLSLQGISVGGTQLSIPKSTFELHDDGSGGVIIDSGTTITYVENSAFTSLKNEFIAQMNLPVDDSGTGGLDLCFNLPAGTNQVEVPKLTFHFKGADLELPGENYMIGDSKAGLLCLAIGSSRGMSIFGNLQQQNFMVVHDLQEETLSFLPTQCDSI